MKILDRHGNPFDDSALEEPQTSKILQLHQEFANHPSRGLTPGKLAQILENAEHGDLMAQCDLFLDMEEKDGHIAAEMGKRKRALLSLPWDIAPPPNATTQEKNTAGIVEDIIHNIPNFEDVILDLADGIGYGYSCLEYEWHKLKHWQPKAIVHRPPRWFTVTQKDRNILRVRDDTGLDGSAFIPFGWIVHIHKAKSGDLTRAGLHRALAWPFLFKNYAIRDRAEFLEIYGMPVRVGQYPRGATDKEKRTLLRAVTNMGHAAAGIIPEGMLVEFKEAATGTGDAYSAMIEWCERTQSKVIVAGTLTSQADGASSTNALGNVHNEGFHSLVQSDAMQIASTLTRDLVGLLCQLNGLESDPLRCPRFVFDTVQAEDMALYADALPKLVSIGVQVPVSYVTDKLRIPVPEDNEPVLSVLSTAAAPQHKIVSLKALPQKNDPTPIDSHYEQLAKDTAKPLNDWTAILKTKVEQAESLEALRDDLLKSYGDLETGTFANIMSLGIASAELSGRFDVDQGD